MATGTYDESPKENPSNRKGNLRRGGDDQGQVESRRPTPSVGRIVHYGVEDFDGVIQPHAAMITRIDPTSTAITLQIFHPSGGQDIQHAEYSDQLAVRCWSWPARV